MLLAGDIGGTKTKLAIFSPERGPRMPLTEATFPSASYASLEALVKEFLAQISIPVDRASFGVAGPVLAGRATITNLPWVIDESQLQRALNLSSVHLLNDLEAIAHAVPSLEPGELHTLHQGQAVPKGNIAVIAPGTGLGEAFLTWNGAAYQTHTSEGGHCDFAPTNELEIGLLRYVLARFEHVSYERVCSGKGIPNIYAYLTERADTAELPALSEQLARAEDRTPLIVNAALDGTSERCVATANTFVSILGSEAGNLALKVLATGGIYLGGGIPPRLLSFLQNGGFLEAFRRKGRFVALLEQMPVHVILNPTVALFGAACYGMEMCL